MPEERVTRDLRDEQARREAREREAAERSDASAESRAHGRRAERAAYLRRRLDERARSERAPGG